MATNKIVIIDDSQVIRMRVREMLPKGDFEVLEAQDGVEGLALICKERPNLIILDFLLPRKSGWEVFQEIQAQPDLQKIPLVVMSGRKEEVTQNIAQPFEFFEFIQKPFEPTELVDAIRAAVAKARRRRTTVATAEGGEVAELRGRVEKLETELTSLKKQMEQLLALIRQKI